MVQPCRNGATCEFLKKGMCIFDHIPAHFEKYMGAIVKRILMVERKVQFLRRARPSVTPNQQIRVRRQSKPPGVTTHSNQNPSSKSLSAEESSPAMLVELLSASPTIPPSAVEKLPHSLAPSAEQPTLPSPSPTLPATLLTPSPPPSNELLHPLPPTSSHSAETPTISPATPVDKAIVPTRQAHTCSESTKSPVPQTSPNRKRAKPPSPSQDTTSVAVTTRATEKKRKPNPQPDCSKAAQQTSTGTEIDSTEEETSDDEEEVQETMPLTQREIKLLEMAKELKEFEADSELIPKERKPQVFALLSLKKVLQKDLKRELAMEEFVGILSGYSDAHEEVRKQQEEVREQQEREHLAFKASGLSHGKFYGYDITE